MGGYTALFELYSGYPVDLPMIKDCKNECHGTSDRVGSSEEDQRDQLTSLIRWSAGQDRSSE